MVKATKKHPRLVVRGFIRGQIVDSKTGKICGDTGWIENAVSNEGLTNMARLLGGQSGSYIVGFAVLATQSTAFNVTQTALVGTTNSFRAVNLSTSGTCTLTCTASFSSSDLGASCNVAAAALHRTNSVGSLIAGQTFASSQWNTNQDFLLTYQIRFSTA